MISFSDIQPISVYLPDEEKWIIRRNRAIEYFKEQGIKPIMWVCGVHAEKFGVESSKPYDRDPQNIATGWRVPQRTVGNYLSWYMTFVVMQSHPEIEYWMIMEDDVRMHENWKERTEQALKDVPEDFQYLILGHCCCEGKPTKHIKGEVYVVEYPQAPTPAIIHRSAIPVIISTCRNATYPMDVMLHDYTYKELRCYTLLPRLAEQIDTFLPA